MLKLDDNYSIALLAANDDGPAGASMPGDVSDNLPDLIRNHPDVRPLFGFCLAGPDGLIPEGCQDWHKTPDGPYFEWLAIVNGCGLDINPVARLDETLKRRGIGRREAALRAGVAPSSFQAAMARGKDMTVETLQLVLSALSIPINRFFSDRYEY